MRLISPRPTSFDFKRLFNMLFINKQPPLESSNGNSLKFIVHRIFHSRFETLQMIYIFFTRKFILNLFSIYVFTRIFTLHWKFKIPTILFKVLSPFSIMESIYFHQLFHKRMCFLLSPPCLLLGSLPLYFNFLRVGRGKYPLASCSISNLIKFYEYSVNQMKLPCIGWRDVMEVVGVEWFEEEKAVEECFQVFLFYANFLL